MFKTKPKEKTHEDRMAEEREVRAELDGKAKRAETEAIGKRDELRSIYQAEFSEDVESYRFECRRWGDFLSVMLKRTQFDWRTGKPSINSHASAINIRDTQEIKLLPGASVADGTLSYIVYMESDQGSGSSWGTGCGRVRAPAGYHYSVKPNYPYRATRGMVVLDPVPDPRERGGMMMGGTWDSQDSIANLRTKPFPQYAVDDAIRFEGARATLCCPYGMGQKIYEQILAEIGDFMLRPQ